MKTIILDAQAARFGISERLHVGAGTSLLIQVITDVLSCPTLQAQPHLLARAREKGFRVWDSPFACRVWAFACRHTRNTRLHAQPPRLAKQETQETSSQHISQDLIPTHLCT